MIWTKKLANMGWNLGLFGRIVPPKKLWYYWDLTILL